MFSVVPAWSLPAVSVCRSPVRTGGQSRDSLTFSCLFPLFAHLFIVRQETVKNIQDRDLYRFVEVTGELYNWQFLLLDFNRQISVTCWRVVNRKRERQEVRECKYFYRQLLWERMIFKIEQGRQNPLQVL